MTHHGLFRKICEAIFCPLVNKTDASICVPRRQSLPPPIVNLLQWQDRPWLMLHCVSRHHGLPLGNSVKPFCASSSTKLNLGFVTPFCGSSCLFRNERPWLMLLRVSHHHGMPPPVNGLVFGLKCSCLKNAIEVLPPKHCPRQLAPWSPTLFAFTPKCVSQQFQTIMLVDDDWTLLKTIANLIKQFTWLLQQSSNQLRTNQLHFSGYHGPCCSQTPY